MIISGTTLTNTGYVVDVQPIYTTGLFAHYDPNSGISGSSFLDSSGNGYTATIYNSPTTVTLANGQKVLQLNSASTQWYAYTAGYSNSGVNGQALTFDAWFNTASAATSQGVIGEWGQAGFSGGWNDTIIGMTTTNLAGGYYNGATSGYVTGPTYTANQWYNVTISCQSGLYTLYINGVQYATVATTRVSSPSPMWWAVGLSSQAPQYLGGVTGYFNGYLGPVKLYIGTLTAQQVAQNFNAVRWRYGV